MCETRDGFAGLPYDQQPRTAATTTTVRIDGAGEAVQAWPPVPVGCACRQEDEDPLGCVPEYDMPGVGAVVPLASYLAVVEALRAAAPPTPGAP